MNRVAKQYVLPYLWITLASAVYAVGFNWCYEPNQIGFGGITGVGQIINHILPWAPIGTVVIILNIPLFLLGWKLLGGHLLVSSLYSMFISSIFIDILHMLHTFEPMEPILGCIFGGVIMGGSLGVVFLQGATTGGTDLIARLLKLKLAWLPMGRLLLAVDLLVIVAVAVAFRNIYSALYGVVALYISSFVMDQVLYGMDNAKVAYHQRRLRPDFPRHYSRYGPGRHPSPRRGRLVRGGQEGAAGGLQAEADRGPQADRQEHRPQRLPDRVRGPRDPGRRLPGV